MAVTHGHGNPDWTRDEVVLALDLYFDCNGSIPSKSDARVVALSKLLRVFPYHANAARRESFRNPDGVVFKLQNLRQVATGKGLGNVSRTDREVWGELGNNQRRVRELATLIRVGIEIAGNAELGLPAPNEEEFVEGRIVTEVHFRRERHPRVRARLIAKRRTLGHLRCDVCDRTEDEYPPALAEAVFEAHHVVPLSTGQVRRTQLKDLALLCANCHRMLHRAIARGKRWLTPEEAKATIVAGRFEN